MPFLGGNPVFLVKAKKGTKNKTNKAKIRRVKGQVRWPFGPPHLTRKPSKKKQKSKPPPKKNKKLRKNKNTYKKNTQKKLFSYQSLFWWVSKFSLL